MRIPTIFQMKLKIESLPRKEIPSSTESNESIRPSPQLASMNPSPKSSIEARTGENTAQTSMKHITRSNL